MMTCYVDGAAHLALVELEADISSNLKCKEVTKCGNPEFIELQPEVTWEMRYQLLEFMAQAQAALDLIPKTLALAANILDRYMSLRVVHARHFQLLGCVCLWLASKTIDEKHNVPSTGTLAFLCAKTYEENMFREMEFHVLCTLEWDILAPVANDFIDMSVAEVARLLNKDISAIDIAKFKLHPGRNSLNTNPSLSFCQQDYNVVKAMSQYICECALFSRDFVGIRPSVIAASAVAFSTTALEILQMRGWPSVYPQGSTQECFETLVSLISQAPSESAARYSGEEQFSASLLFVNFFEAYTRPVTHISPYYTTESSSLASFSVFDSSSQPLTPERSQFDYDSNMGTVQAHLRAVSNNAGMPLTPENENAAPSGKY